MLPDLERLILLQDIERRAAAAARIVADAPGTLAALATTLANAKAGVESAKAAIADNQVARRALERDLQTAQQRLDKYKDQSMAVKTNEEFHAMQHQMAAVKADIDRLEGSILEVMMTADDLQQRLTGAEATLKAQTAAVAAQQAAVSAERDANAAIVSACAAERAALVAQMTPSVVATFDKVARQRAGVGVARAEQERCVVCQVRLRPMVYTAVKRNDSITQCDSCQRILYFIPPTPAS
jgi:predicted  nucleic acid-binding Zn-ribbon protein